MVVKCTLNFIYINQIQVTNRPTKQHLLLQKELLLFLLLVITKYKHLQIRNSHTHGLIHKLLEQILILNNGKPLTPYELLVKLNTYHHSIDLWVIDLADDDLLVAEGDNIRFVFVNVVFVLIQ